MDNDDVFLIKLKRNEQPLNLVSPHPFAMAADPEPTSPLLKANKIVNERSEEQERRHGPFSAGMQKAATIASVLCGKEITTEDTFKVLMALKLSRMAHSLEMDSVVDLMGYTEGLWNYSQEHKNQIKHETK